MCTQVLSQEQLEHRAPRPRWAHVRVEKGSSDQPDAAQPVRAGLTADVRRFQGVQGDTGDRVHRWDL